MIWTDNDGRRWIVRQLGRTSGQVRIDEDGHRPPAIVPEGTVVVAFISMDGTSESRVIAGAPKDWSERPETLPELFARAGKRRD